MSRQDGSLFEKRACRAKLAQQRLKSRLLASMAGCIARVGLVFKSATYSCWGLRILYCPDLTPSWVGTTELVFFLFAR